MLRKAFIIASALSLVVFVGTVVTAARSYHREVTLCYDTEEGLPRRTKVLVCSQGTFEWLELRTQFGGATSTVPRFALPAWAVATALAAGGVYSVRAAARHVERVRNS